MVFIIGLSLKGRAESSLRAGAIRLRTHHQQHQQVHTSPLTPRPCKSHCRTPALGPKNCISGAWRLGSSCIRCRLKACPRPSRALSKSLSLKASQVVLGRLVTRAPVMATVECSQFSTNGRRSCSRTLDSISQTSYKSVLGASFPSSFLLLAVRPGAPSSVPAPSSKATSP